MSIEEVQPVTYAPVRVVESQVSRFFNDLKLRKIVKGQNISSYILTDKPLATDKTIQKQTGITYVVDSDGKHRVRRKRSVTSLSKPKSLKPSKKKRKGQIEKSISEATL